MKDSLRTILRRLQKEKTEESGITLIALAVTIVVLLILAAVTITFVLGEDGIINKAKEAANAMNNAVVNDQTSLNGIGDTINGIVNRTGGSGDANPEPEKPEWEGPTGIQDSTVEAQDEYGNKVTIPKGFEVVVEEGTTVPEGIVIQDKDGNQFVWIPVGKVYKDSTGTNYSDIQLGRYTFNKTNGTPTPVQLAYTDEEPENYKQEIELKTSSTFSVDYIEYATREHPDGLIDESDHLNDLNAIAKNLEAFVESVKDNGGYYIARYEASYGSGDSVANYKPLSQVSKATSFSTSKVGSLWNYVTQLDAAKISRNMYSEGDNVGVESDLVNSYAWDTAIVFIQAMGNGNENYANKKSVNSSRANTGTIGDKACNIHDMASNCYEWSTEYSSNTSSSYTCPCVFRGGHYDYNFSISYTSGRCSYYDASHWDSGTSFRSLLYVK